MPTLRAGPRTLEYEGGGGGGIECRRHDLSSISCKEGGEYERGFPPLEAFSSLFKVKMSGFKLNFESKFDILFAIFCLNFSLY